MDQLDLIDIYRTFHPKTINFTFFSSAHGTFSRTDHILGHKSSLGKFKKIEIIPIIFSDHSAVRLDLNYRKKIVKNSNIWRLNSTLLNNQQIIEQIKKNQNMLDIHTEETRSERDTCTPMFIAALFIIARTWKQPKWPSADEWIRKLWYIYTMEYYSDIKKNSLESVLMRWMKLEPIIQSEVSQKDKEHYSILTHIYGI